MKVGHFTCVGAEHHAIMCEIPDALSEKDFLHDMTCSHCGSKFVRSDDFNKSLDEKKPKF